jgi:nucleoside 2-deoxyribosyltransferase
MENLVIQCNSGGAIGSDTIFENECQKYGIKVNAFSYKTDYHNSTNKAEITDEDFAEGVEQIKKANRILKRVNIDKYINLLARNWSQVKYSQQIFAIGKIVDFDKGIIDGGTGWAVGMAISNKKDTYVYDQILKSWHRYSYIVNKFIKINNIPKIIGNFAGIGTRKINEFGEKAIKELLKSNFSSN